MSFRTADPERIRDRNPSARSQRNFRQHAARDLDSHFALDESIAYGKVVSSVGRSRRLTRFPGPKYREATLSEELDCLRLVILVAHHRLRSLIDRAIPPHAFSEFDPLREFRNASQLIETFGYFVKDLSVCAAHDTGDL